MNTRTNTNQNNKIANVYGFSGKTQEIVITGLFIALTFVATWLINIRLPIMGSGGLIHLGNVPVFLGAIIYGKRLGAASGAIGMSLFDLMGGWVAWAPFTFIINGVMGYAVGLITEKPVKNKHLLNIASICVALVIKLVGYYTAEGIIYGNWIAPLGSMPGDITQVVVAAIIVLPIVERLKKYACR